MDNKQVNKLKSWYKSYLGDFSFKSLLNISIVAIITLVLPFFGSGFSLSIFLSVSFWVLTIFKIALNLFTKRNMALHTIDIAFINDEDLKDTHKDIKKSREYIESNKLNKYLPKALREENLKNKLDDLYDMINDKMNKEKDDKKIIELTKILENIESYLEYIEQNKSHDDMKEVRNSLARHLAGVKTVSLTQSSLYSKNDTVTRGKVLGVNLDIAVRKLMVRSAGIAIIMVVSLSAIDLFSKGLSFDGLAQAIINIMLIVYSGTMGVYGGQGIINEYKNVAIYKSEFLKSFINKSEHYSKPSEEESILIEQKKDEKLERDRKDQEYKEERKYKREIEREKRKLEHEATMAKIQADSERAKVEILAIHNQPLKETKQVVQEKTEEDKKIEITITK